MLLSNFANADNLNNPLTVQPDKQITNTDNIYQDKLRDNLENLTQKKPQQSAESQTQKTNYTSAEIIQQPELLEKLLINALNQNKLSQIQFLLKLYQQSAEPDQELMLYGQATIARLTGDLSKAIQDYQTVLAQNPEFQYARLALAITFLQDQQKHNAEQVFQQLQNTSNLDPQIVQLIQQYQQQLAIRNKLAIKVDLAYLYNNNLNNAVKDSIQYTSDTSYWQFPKAEAGQALKAKLNLSKDYNLYNNHYLSLNTNFELTEYLSWQQHKNKNNYSKLTQRQLNQLYNDSTWYHSIAWAYKKHNYEGNLAIFQSVNWSANKLYQINYGLSYDLNYNFSHKCYLFSYAEYSKKKYQQAELATILNGHKLYLASNLAYQLLPQTSISVGSNYTVEHSRRPGNSYHKTGFNFSLNQRYPYLAYALAVSYATTKYQGKLLFAETRKDREHAINLSLWSPKLTWQGISPKLSLRTSRLFSNHILYNNRNINTITLNFTKQF